MKVKAQDYNSMMTA